MWPVTIAGPSPSGVTRISANYRPTTSSGCADWGPFCGLAGGLDRTHSGQVRDVLVMRPSDDRVTIDVVAAANPDVDLWSARRRAKAFEKVFHATLSIRWQGDGPPAAHDDRQNSVSATAG